MDYGATPPPPVDSEYRKLLESQGDWGDMAKRMTAHAGWQARKKGWVSGDRQSLLPRGRTPDDVACDAIAATWDGTRRWNPEKYKHVYSHLKNAVWSIMSDLYDLDERKDRVETPCDEEGDQDFDIFRMDPAGRSHLKSRTGNELLPGDISGAHLNGPADAADALLRTKEREELESRLTDALSGSPELGQLFDLFVEGRAPREIAEKMGLKRKDVYNLDKRLDRCLGPLREHIRQHLSYDVQVREREDILPSQKPKEGDDERTGEPGNVPSDGR